MKLRTYQIKAHSSADYGHNPIYPRLGLVGEVGELCNKLKKIIRDNGGMFTPDKLEAVSFEIGDILWYVAECLTVDGEAFKVSFDEVKCNSFHQLQACLVDKPIISWTKNIEYIIAASSHVYSNTDPVYRCAKCIELVIRIADLCINFNLNLDKIATDNLKKLENRVDNDTVKGDGDNR